MKQSYQTPSVITSSTMSVPQPKALPPSTTGKQIRFIRFDFPLCFTYTNCSGVKTESLGTLTVEGLGYYYPHRTTQYAVDIDYAFFNDTDIKAALIHFGCMEEIEAAALNYCIDTFHQLTA